MLLSSVSLTKPISTITNTNRTRTVAAQQTLPTTLTLSQWLSKAQLQYSQTPKPQSINLTA